MDSLGKLYALVASTGGASRSWQEGLESESMTGLLFQERLGVLHGYPIYIYIHISPFWVLYVHQAFPGCD